MKMMSSQVNLIISEKQFTNLKSSEIHMTILNYNIVVFWNTYDYSEIQLILFQINFIVFRIKVEKV